MKKRKNRQSQESKRRERGEERRERNELRTSGGGGGKEKEKERESDKTLTKLRYSTSPGMSALHMLGCIVLSRGLKGILPHRNTCEGLAIFFEKFRVKDSVGPLFVPPSLLFLAEFWQDPSEEIRRTARTLFTSCCQHVSGEERQDYIRHWLARLKNKKSTEEAKATSAIVLGLLANDFPDCLDLFLPPPSTHPSSFFLTGADSFSLSVALFPNPSSSSSSFSSPKLTPKHYTSTSDLSRYASPAVTSFSEEIPNASFVCAELIRLALNGPPSIQISAMDVIGQGYKIIWHKHTGNSLSSLILKCFSLSFVSPPTALSSIASATLKHISQTSPGSVVSLLITNILTNSFSISTMSAALRVIRSLLDQHTRTIAPLAVAISAAVVHLNNKSLDQGDSKVKDACSKIIKATLHDLTQRCPMVSHNKQSQLLAVGGEDGFLSVYDLKQGVRTHYFDVHPKEIHHHPSPSSFSALLTNAPPLSLPLVADSVALSGIVAVAFNPQAKMVACYSYQEGQMYCWQLHSSPPLSLLGISQKPQITRIFPVPRQQWGGLHDIHLVWTSSKVIELTRSKNLSMSFSL